MSGVRPRRAATSWSTSSTPAMLTELKEAIDAEEDIVGDAWRPFWANNAFPVKDLEDPKGALGEAEGLHDARAARASPRSSPRSPS